MNNSVEIRKRNITFGKTTKSDKKTDPQEEEVESEDGSEDSYLSDVNRLRDVMTKERFVGLDGG